MLLLRPSGRSVISIAVAALLAALVAFAIAAAPAPAVVPPADCGGLEVGGKHYKIKADQLRCKQAKKYSAHYLADGKKPKGYSCEKYGGDTKIAFRCQDGIKVFFAIRR